MTVQLILTLISFLIFVIYNSIAQNIFDIPSSLSNTYYLYNEKKKGLGIIFSIMMVLCAGLLMPAWLDISVGSNFQFLIFFCCAMLCFVGYAPNFKGTNIESIVHSASAIASAVFGLLWVILVTPYWYIVLICAVLILFAAYNSKTLKKCYVYWLEMIAFYSIYISIIDYYFFLFI